MDNDSKLFNATSSRWAHYPHSLAQAVYHQDFRRGPVTSAGTDVFIELDSLEPYVFEVTGNLQEIILVSPQVPF
jgi:hypothetical protein